MKFYNFTAVLIPFIVLFTACTKKKSTDHEKTEIFTEITKKQSPPDSPHISGRLRFKLDAPPELLDLRRVLKTRRASLLKCNRISDLGEFEVHISAAGTVTSCTKIPPSENTQTCICQVIKNIRLPRTEGGIAIITTWSEE